MEKPKFKVPLYFEKRTGRITIFLASFAAVSYLIVRFSSDYKEIYEKFNIAIPPITQTVLTTGSNIQELWWIAALAAVMIALLFLAVTKTGTIFTVVSIIIWLVGAASYLALWLPLRGMNVMMDGQ